METSELARAHESGSYFAMFYLLDVSQHGTAVDAKHQCDANLLHDVERQQIYVKLAFWEFEWNPIKRRPMIVEILFPR